MNTTVKRHLFTNKQNEMAMLAKALAHPARIAIIEYLIKGETYIYQDIVRELQLAASTVTTHLQFLINVGMIKRKKGEIIAYGIDEKALLKLQLYLTVIIKKAEKKKGK